jgi:iron complex transport system substrate-binding protein
MFRLSRASAQVVAFAAVLLGCAGVATAEETTAGRPVDTSRIISIGGDVTEILYALGKADRIVAVDTTSLFPPEALATKKSVGYMRALSTEGVLATNPTAIIATNSAGPPDVVAALKASSVPYIQVAFDDTAEGVQKKVAFIAETVGAKAEGEALNRRIAGEFETLGRDRGRINKPVRALFILAMQGGRVMVGGKGTGADAIFQLAGAENAVADLEGYKPLSDEAALTIAPDAIVIMKSAGGGNHAVDIKSMRGLGDTPAARAGHILEVDGSYVLQFGPRAAAAARDLMLDFYPDLRSAQK